MVSLASRLVLVMVASRYPLSYPLLILSLITVPTFILSRMLAVRDVCMWIESIGLGQYRKKFLHNIIDGYMLFTLDDTQLKQELGIGPLGHRVSLLRAVEALGQYGGISAPQQQQQQRYSSPARGRPSSAAPHQPQQPPAARSPQQEYPRRPASASPAVIPPDSYLGPAAGKVTVYEQRSKLLFELDRAAARAAQHKSLADQLLHTANLSEEEVCIHSHMDVFVSLRSVPSV